ncbi:hypothetical protein FRC12_024578 [Ceratobasidium sp. 428]|nr:hypothetical protein FRC12_024578 [Ceratobasidium sp. 428]
MAPLRAELSTVSLPPQDLLLAKRRAKAIKRGISPSVLANDLARQKKRQGKAPAPTLASLRERRLGRELGYYNPPPNGDGCFKFKRINRRPPLVRTPAVPYLAGQEDIPHSDTESDATGATAPELAPQGVDVTMQDAESAEAINTHDEEDEDADADGEDEDADEDDEDAEGEDDDVFMAAPTFAPHPFVGQPWPQYIDVGAGPTFDNQSGWSTTSLDLLKDTDPEDLQALFGGLQDLTASKFDVLTGSAGEPFAMHQLYTAVDNLEATQPLQRVSSHTNNHAMAPVPGIDQPALPSSSASSSRYPRANTPRPTVSVTNSRPHNSLGFTLAPARVLPSLVDLTGSTSPEDQAGYDSDIGCPSTPVALDDTDIGLTDRPVSAPTSPFSTRFQPWPETSTGPRRAPYPGRTPARQIQSRSSRMLNTRRLLRQIARGRGAPTLLELRSNARKVHTRQRRRRVRNSSGPGSNTRPLRIGLRSSELTGPQQALMPAIELHLTRSLFFTHPWPKDHEKLLREAVEYAEEVSGVVADAGVMSDKFKETSLGKLSSLRSSPLSKIEYMMEEKHGVATGDDDVLIELMSNDSFLYPTPDCEPTQYFCVGTLCDTIEIMVFRSTKSLGQAYFEDLVSPDDAAECLQWHRKLRDGTARQGVPPALIALAATMMFWALDKIYLGTSVRFEEGRYDTVFERYFRTLVALPHLGKLRADLLDHLKAYYMDRWPAPEEHDDDDDTPLAW